MDHPGTGAFLAVGFDLFGLGFIGHLVDSDPAQAELT
jgi:hypothetical protein